PEAVRRGRPPLRGRAGAVAIEIERMPNRVTPDHGHFGAPVHRNAAPPHVKSYLLTVQEVASLLRVCRTTVYSLCERGQLAHTRIGASIRIQPRDVELLLRAARLTNQVGP